MDSTNERRTLGIRFPYPNTQTNIPLKIDLVTITSLTSNQRHKDILSSTCTFTIISALVQIKRQPFRLEYVISDNNITDTNKVYSLMEAHHFNPSNRSCKGGGIVSRTHPRLNWMMIRPISTPLPLIVWDAPADIRFV